MIFFVNKTNKTNIMDEMDFLDERNCMLNQLH
jgi:hypothetical protein